VTDDSQTTNPEVAAPLLDPKLAAEVVEALSPGRKTGSAEDIPARAGVGLVRTPDPETSEFARHVHQYNREYIALADQKAAFVFATASALLVCLYQNDAQTRWLKSPSLWSASDLFVFAAMALLFASIALAAGVVLPRLVNTHRGFVFFNSIAEFESASEYAISISRESGDSLTSAILRHTYDLARICKRKYDMLFYALWCGAAGVSLSIIVLLLGLRSAG